MHWVKRDPQERVYLPLSPSYRLSHLLLKIIVVSDSWAEVVWLDIGARVTPVLWTVPVEALFEWK